MQVYALRHGETNFNLACLCNDDPRREVHLTERGRQQAAAAARALEQIPLQRILCSELPRTRETAKIINRQRGLPIETHWALNDIRSGCDGRPVTDYQQAIAHDPLNARVRGGETLLEHKERVLGFLHWLAQEPQDSVLVVAHEETLRVFWSLREGLSDEQMLGLSFDNCAHFSFRLPDVLPQAT